MIEILRSRVSGARVAALLLCLPATVPAMAGDKVLATWGVTQIEGSAGGGLSTSALIAGSGSRNQIAATAAVTTLRTQGGFGLRVAGVAVGLYDTVELSAARWRFSLSDTVPGQSIGMDVIGAKWRVYGNALYDQDRWWPQVAIGAYHKRNRDFTVPQALGARRDSDVDLTLSATKLWLAGLAGRNTLLNTTLRATRANQFGLLGFGGDNRDAHRLQLETTAAVLPRDDVALGVEWRSKPDNLSAFREEHAMDVFVAWFPTRHLSATLAWVDLGNVADKPGQHGWYLSLQGGF